MSRSPHDIGILGFLQQNVFIHSKSLFTGNSGEGGRRRDPQGNVLTPVLGPTAEKIHHPGLLEQPGQRLQPGQLPQVAETAN